MKKSKSTPRLVYVDFSNLDTDDAVIMWDKLDEAMEQVPPNTKKSFGVYEFSKFVQVIKTQELKIIEIGEK